MTIDWKKDVALKSFGDIMALKLQRHEGKKVLGSSKEMNDGFWRELGDMFNALEILNAQLDKNRDGITVEQLSTLRQVVAEEGADAANQIFLIVLEACYDLEDLSQTLRKAEGGA